MQDGGQTLPIPPVLLLGHSATTTTLGGGNKNNNRAPTTGVPPRVRTPRGPGGAVRSTDSPTPPIPPPRPESTLTSRSRPVVPVKTTRQPAPSPTTTTQQPSVPSIPQRPLPEASLVMLGRPPSPPLPPVANISLTSPRPGPNRTQNLYVDAPLRSPSGCAPVVKQQPLSRAGSIPLPQSTSKRVSAKTGSSADAGGKRPLLLSSQPLSVIQPSSNSTLKKRSEMEAGTSSDNDVSESILCRDCGRCRCKACREPRRLPEHYLCHKKCLCSTETVVDTLSGMCLVKALFYHCGKDYVAEADAVFENPCSCTGEYAGARWGCMAAMSLFMPCLLCYLPMKGCAQACQSVYARCTTNGCRCEPGTSSGLFNVRNNNVESDSQSAVTTTSSGPSSPVGSEKRLLGELST